MGQRGYPLIVVDMASSLVVHCISNIRICLKTGKLDGATERGKGLDCRRSKLEEDSYM